MKLMILRIRLKGDHHLPWRVIGGHSFNGGLVRNVGIVVVAIETVDMMRVDSLQNLLELLGGVQMEESAWAEEVMDVLPWVFCALYSLLNRKAHYHVRRDLEFYSFCFLLLRCVWLYMRDSLDRNTFPLHVLKVFEQRIPQKLSRCRLDKLLILVECSLDE